MTAQSGMRRIALVIGLLGAVGPFAIDMYLPALPEVAAELEASAQATQFTLTAFFLAFGVSQLVYGPAADQFPNQPFSPETPFRWGPRQWGQSAAPAAVSAAPDRKPARSTRGSWERFRIKSSGVLGQRGP